MLSVLLSYPLHNIFAKLQAELELQAFPNRVWERGEILKPATFGYKTAFRNEKFHEKALKSTG
jgi:hypothetical protein